MKRHSGETPWMVANENSVAPVMRLATGHPPPPAPLEVWSLRKSKCPPGSINWKTLKRSSRKSPPNLNVCLPCDQVSESEISTVLSAMLSLKNVEPQG